MPSFAFIGDQGQMFAHPTGSGDVVTATAQFGVNELGGVDFIFLFAPLQNVDRARQMGAILRRAVTSGAVLIAAFPLTVDPAFMVAINEIVEVDFTGSTQQRVRHSLPEFQQYFELYGATQISFDDTGVTDVVGWRDEYPPVLAACFEVGEGAVYLIPYFLPGLPNEFVPYLWNAVDAHRSGRPGRVPSFLEDVFLPGEEDLLREIAQHQRRIAELSGEAAKLRRFRLLLGRLSSQPLEDLVIETLNVVLAGTGYEAQDRPDVGHEDFWLVQNGADAAFAEVKALGRNISRGDVSKADAHRDEMGANADDVPALLVANIFRNSTDLAERQQAPSAEVLLRAKQTNVLILRTFDLFTLLVHTRKGVPVGGELVAALAQGGGWLRASEETVDFV